MKGARWTQIQEYERRGFTSTYKTSDVESGIPSYRYTMETGSETDTWKTRSYRLQDGITLSFSERLRSYGKWMRKETRKKLL